MRYLVLILVFLLSVAFVFVNWGALNQDTTVNLFFTNAQAPLGLMLVILSGLLIVVLLGTLVIQQGAALLGYRRMLKDLDAQKKLAANAENSRLEAVRKDFENKLQDIIAQQQKETQALEGRLSEAAKKQLESLERTVGEVKQSNGDLAASVNSTLQNMDDKITKALISANQTAQLAVRQNEDSL